MLIDSFSQDVFRTDSAALSTTSGITGSSFNSLIGIITMSSSAIRRLSDDLSGSIVVGGC